MKLRLCILAMLSLGFCSCQGVTELSSFVLDSTVRLELDGNKVFSYDEADCQLAFNESRCEFRAHSDTMLDYFVLQLSEIPNKTGTAVTANIRWSTLYGESEKENVTLETKRISGDIIWLCDASRHTAVVVRVLE